MGYHSIFDWKSFLNANGMHAIHVYRGLRAAHDCRSLAALGVGAVGQLSSCDGLLDTGGGARGSTLEGRVGNDDVFELVLGDGLDRVCVWGEGALDLGVSPRTSQCSYKC